MTKPVPPPDVGMIVGELGFRYRPSAHADLEAHAHAIRLLAEDLAHVPISLLDRAAQRWAQTKPYLPRACELIDMVDQMQAASIAGTAAARDALQAHCDELNAKGGGRFWFVAGTPPNRRVESRPR